MTFVDLKASNAPWQTEIEEAALRVLRSGRYIGGPEVEAFEAALAASCGAPLAVGVSSGLDALRLTLRAWVAMGRLRVGDEVMVAANTYIASVLAIVDAGLTPLLVEPDETTMNLSGAAVERNLSPRTRAIMPVHLYGRPAWDAQMAEAVERHGLLVIEDNAQAIGARATAPGIDGKSTLTGSLGHVAAFSFYPTKNVGALGDAGAVTTADPQLAATVRALANYGSDRRYHNILAGYNCRLDPLQAAMTAVKLAHLDEITAKRRERAEEYAKLLHNPLLTLPKPEAGHVWHQYVVRVGGGKRDALCDTLAKLGVPTDIHYAVPPHLQPCFRQTLAHGPLPITERLATEVVSLPVAESVEMEEIGRIADTINKLTL